MPFRLFTRSQKKTMEKEVPLTPADKPEPVPPRVQEALAAVYKRRNDACTLIEELCRMRFGSGYQTKLAGMQNCFCKILQAVLLLTAVEDSVLHPSEYLFLQSFNHCQSLLADINRQARWENPNRTVLTLPDFDQIDTVQKEQLSRLIRSSLSLRAQTFYEAFASSDYAVPGKDYLGELKACAADIASIMTTIDGDIPGNARSEQELSAGLAAFYDIIERNWKSHNPNPNLGYTHHPF